MEKMGMLRACQLPRTVLLQIEKANMSDSNSKELAYKNRTPIGQASGFVAEETEIEFPPYSEELVSYSKLCCEPRMSFLNHLCRFLQPNGFKTREQQCRSPILFLAFQPEASPTNHCRGYKCVDSHPALFNLRSPGIT